MRGLRVVFLFCALILTLPAGAQTADDVAPDPVDALMAMPAQIREPSQAESQRLTRLRLQKDEARAAGQTREALGYEREALAILEGTLGPTHPQVAWSLFEIGMHHLTLGEAAESIAPLRRSTSILETLGDRPVASELLSYALTALGKALGDVDQSAEAETVLRRAVTILERLRSSRGIALGLLALAENLDEQGKNAEAEPIIRRALAIYETVLADANMTAKALGALGGNLLSQTRVAEAEAVLRRAVAVGEAGAQPAVVAMLLCRLGDALLFQGKLDEGDQAYRRALEIARTTPQIDDRVHVAALMQTAGVALLRGRVREAEGHTREALTIAEAGGQDADTLSGMLGNLSAAIFQQGRRDEALALLQRALEYAPDDPILLMTTANLMEDEELPQATNMLRRAVASAESAGMDDGPGFEMILASLGSNLYERGELEESERVLTRALNQAERFQNNPNLGFVLWILVGLRIEQGDERGAQTVLRRIIAEQDLVLGQNNTQSGSAAEVLAERLLLEGRAEEALPFSRRALASRSLRVAATTNVSQIALNRVAAQSRGASALVLRVAFEVNRARPNPSLLAEAFAAAQQTGPAGSSRAFSEGFARVAADEAGLGSAVTAWRAASERVLTIDQSIADEARRGRAGDDRRRRLAGERAAAEADREQQETIVRERFPRFFDLIASPAVSLNEAQSLLGSSEALLLLTPGDAGLPDGRQRGLVFAVTREGAAWAEIALGPEELSAEIVALHAQLETGGATRAANTGASDGTVSGARGFDRARSYRLYQALLGAPEIAALVQGKQRWTLAPQGMLLSAPFAALVVEPPAGGEAGDSDPASLRAARWLGLTRTLSVTPSIAALNAQRRLTPARASAQNVAFFGLGDPAFDGQPGPTRGGVQLFTERGANVDAVRALPRLPGTRAEIEELARAFGARREDYVLDVSATERELNRRSADGSLRRAEVIAFATHGLMAGDLAGGLAEPALALTPPRQASQTDDGLLTASEASRLRLNARWVILSACNTAAGGEPDADGLTGLAQSFFYAGARTLLVSQWPVNDDAARRLTTRAVELQRTANLSPADAMGRSMAELQRDVSRDERGRSFAHPSAWAPFILVTGE